MEVGPNGSNGKNTTTLLPPFNNSTRTTKPPPPPPQLVDQKVIDEIEKNYEFYKTYDVMTGIRIAATLGGFFGLMVILVLYKSKSKTEKALEDPDFTAAAVAEVEEEDERQLAAVLEATAYQQQLNVRKMSRRSLDTSSMPAGWIRTTTRFSSVGGYSSLLEPPIRTHSRLPCFVDEDSPPPDEDDRSLYDDVYYNRHLEVPRRPSNITCSSSGSSYLERRDSACVAGLPALPAHKSWTSKNRRRQSSPLPEIYDFYYPIDIRVIQPTPGGTPCGSDRAIYDHVVTDHPPPTTTSNLKPRLAPLASISSCNSSLGGYDYPDLDLPSYVSDSVFNEDDIDDDIYDTDDEIEQFSTDSEEGACYSRRKRCTNNERPPCILPEICISKSSSTLVESPDDDDDDNGEELPDFSSNRRKLSTDSSQLEERKWAQETLF